MNPFGLIAIVGLVAIYGAWFVVGRNNKAAERIARRIFDEDLRS